MKTFKIEFENAKGNKTVYTLKEIKHLSWSFVHGWVNIVISTTEGIKKLFWPVDKIFINEKCLSKSSVLEYI